MRRQGFTLLEVVVAMAMLSLGLMAIFDLNSRAVSLHAYGKKLTVATLLARGQMIEIEQQLIDDGFSSDDDEESGDFSELGWPNFKWRARILAPQTSGVSPMQVIAGLLGLPIDASQGDIGQLLGMGGDTTEGPQGQDPVGGGLGPLAGLAETQMTAFVENIKNSVREVHLTVYWEDMGQTEQVDLAMHVVSTGQRSDRDVRGPDLPPPNQRGPQ